MIARSSSHHRTCQHATASFPNQNCMQSTSRPGTPSKSRGESHSHRSPFNSHRTSLQFMSDRPVSPNQKRPGRRRRDGAPTSAQRNRARQDPASLTVDRELFDDDEEMLHDILGVTSPLPPRTEPSSKVGGLPVSAFPLDISATPDGTRNRYGYHAADSEPERVGKAKKSSRDISRPEKALSGRALEVQARSAKQRAGRGRREHEIMSEGELIHHGRIERQRVFPRNSSSDGYRSPSADTVPNSSSAINATRTNLRGQPPVSVGPTPRTDSELVFDLSQLSQSLPGARPLALIPPPIARSRSARRFIKSGDESVKWDMPDMVGSLNKQELTVRPPIPNEPTDIASSGSRSSKTPLSNHPDEIPSLSHLNGD